MNRYVIVLHESYDQYSPVVPHPVSTRHTREEILEVVQQHLDRLSAWFAVYNPRTALPHSWNPPYLLEPLLDTGLAVEGFEVGYPVEGNPTAVWKLLAEVLTVDEWFEKYGNRRFNQDNV